MSVHYSQHEVIVYLGRLRSSCSADLRLSEWAKQEMYLVLKTATIVLVLLVSARVHALSFVEAILSNQGFPSLEQANGSIRVSPDGHHIYLAGGSFSHTVLGELIPATGGVVTFSRDINTGRLSFVDAIVQGVDADNLIAGEHDISPDGEHVYVPAGLDAFFGGRRDLLVYKRDKLTGALSLIEEVIGLGGLVATVSPDGRNVYVLGGQTNLPDLHIFTRNEADGTVKFLEKVSALVSSLDRPRSVVVSQDGRNVYILVFEGRVITFVRDQATGALTRSQITSVPNDRLDSIVASSDGRHLYVGSNSTCFGCGIYALSRDESTGDLTLIGQMPAQVDASGMAISPDGMELYVNYRVQVLTRDAGTGVLTPSQIFTEGVDGVTGITGARALDVSPDGKNVYVTGNNNETASIAVFERPINVDSDGLVELSGTLRTVNGEDICAMVLASGQFMFSCNPNGVLSLSDLPRENDGNVKRQIYADGFFPKIDVLTGSSNDAVVMTRSGTCPSYNPFYDPAVVSGSAGQRINISGKVLAQNSQTPICAMVLANGQHMFSCDGSGSYALNIPLDTNGQFKLQVYADGFAPTIQTFDEFKATNDVRMARATECQ